ILVDEGNRRRAGIEDGLSDSVDGIDEPPECVDVENDQSRAVRLGIGNRTADIACQDIIDHPFDRHDVYRTLAGDGERKTIRRLLSQSGSHSESGGKQEQTEQNGDEGAESHRYTVCFDHAQDTRSDSVHDVPEATSCGPADCGIESIVRLSMSRRFTD